MRVLIVGFSQPGHMGSYLASAAKQLGLDYQIIDAGRAEASSRIGQSFHWRMRGKRPGRLRRFGAQVLDACAEMRHDLVLATGRAPLDRSHIEGLRALDATVINYSTDDPWNPALRARWFLAAIPSYDAIFSPRRANLDDFRRCGVRAVHFLPFAYDPEVHRPWTDMASAGPPSDVLFVGGCDADRLPLIGALIDAGLNLALFGGYWNRHIKTRPYWRGLADQDTIRSASATAQVCLCLVRRANRDGNVMRSFEAAAIGGCILAEDTDDHRALFGPEDHAARYFRTPTELVQQAKILTADAEARRRLSARLRERMAAGGNTYADRLAAMLRLSGMDSSPQDLAVPA
ncbi:MAG: glycosyltransferase [Xanthobacteraceae bacterium]